MKNFANLKFSVVLNENIKGKLRNTIPSLEV